MNPIVGVLLRLVVTYVLYLTMLRSGGKRIVAMGSQGDPEPGVIGTPFDFVLALMISDLPDDMIYGEVPLAKGVVAVGTFIIIHLIVNYAAFRLPWFHRLVAGGPDLIIKQGRTVRETMRRHRITDSELATMLRMREVHKRDEVAEAQLEPSDTLSIKKKPGAKPATRRDLAE